MHAIVSHSLRHHGRAADTAFTDMTVPSTSAAILSTRGALSIANCPLTNMQAADNTTIVLAEHRGTLTLQGQPACSGCAGNIYAISDDALAFADKVPGVAPSTLRMCSALELFVYPVLIGGLYFNGFALDSCCVPRFMHKDCLLL